MTGQTVSKLSGLSQNELGIFFSAFVNNVDDLIICLSLDYEILEFNFAAEHVFLWPSQDVLGKNFKELCEHHHISIPIPEDHSQLFQGQPICDQESTLTRADGSEFKISWIISGVRDPEGKPHGYILVGQNVTQLRSVEQYAQDMEIVIDNLISNVPNISIYWKNKEGVYLGCNNFVLQMAGLKSQDEIVGKTDFDLPWKAVAEKTQRFDHEVIETGEAKILEETGKLADGTQIFFMSSKLPMKNKQGENVGVMGIAVDITERKMMEKQLIESKANEKANEAKSEFIANMSHDLRTPLVAICGIAELLKFDKDFPKDERQKLADDLGKSGEILLHLVESILDFSKVKSGKLPVTMETFDLLEVTENVISMFTEQANKKNIKLISSFASECPRYIVGDPHRVNRIIANLLENAIKFTEQGHVLVSLELIQQNQNKAEIQLVVEDTGIGIPKEKIDKIFERFCRVDPSYRGRYKGTGLGLNIVQQFVESMGGEIGVNSQLGYGATFYCSLPFELPDIIELRSTWQRHYADVKILMVDDYGVRGKQLLDVVGSKHSKLISSDKVFSELEEAAKNDNPYQIIIIDDEIFDIEPDELARKIHHLQGYEQALLLLMFMNSYSDDDVRSHMRAGFFECLPKPLQPTELTGSLTRCWQNWNRQFKDLSERLIEFKPNILLVEDNQVSHQIISAMLETMGCSVTVAESGEAALELLPKSEFDLAFLDLGLPGMDGLSLAQKMKSVEDKANSTPLIALTAHVSENDKANCFQSGMDDFIAKPASAQALKQVLLQHIFQ